MQVSDLREVVQMLHPLRTADAMGGASTVWQVGDTIRASVRATSAPVENIHGKLELGSKIKLYVRLPVSLTLDTRLRWRDADYTINDFYHMDSQHRWCVIIAERVHV